MYYAGRFLPVFSVILKEDGISPFFRCKIKVYKYAEGSVLLSEVVNSPKDTINIGFLNETFRVNCHDGYGLSAVYSPLPPKSFFDCCFSVY